MKNIILKISISCVLFTLISCAGKPKVEIEIENVIFLEQESLHEKPLYVSIRNQTDLYTAGEFIYEKTIELLHKKGFKTTNKAKDSLYQMQAVLLNIKKDNKKMGLKEALAFSAVGAGGGAIIGAATAGSNTGKSAGVGAGVGLGVGLLGFTVASLAEKQYWYGIVEIEITEPEIASITERISKTREDIYNKEAPDTLETTTTATYDTSGRKKKKRTKMMVRISGSSIDEEQAVIEISKAVSYRLANFF